MLEPASGSSVVGEVGVVIGAIETMRVGVHDGRCQPRYRVNEPVLGLDSDGVRRRDGQLSRHNNVTLRTQPVTDPPHVHRAHRDDAGRSLQRVLDLVDQRGIDRIHDAAGIPRGRHL